MKIKIMNNTDMKKLEDDYNELDKIVNIVATQTHIVSVSNTIFYVFVVYFREKDLAVKGK